MKKPASSIQFIHYLYQQRLRTQGTFPKGEAGYTLIELLVVIIMIGILAGIAAPGWIGFVNQRRVTAANELVLRALQEAQSQAKNKKLSYSVSFRNDADGVPEIAVYQTKKTDGTNFAPSNWKSFRGELGIQPGQLMLGTNLDDENKTGGLSFNLNNPENKKITFDYLGALPTGANTNLAIVVAIPRRGTNPVPINPTKRCVKVTTLLGAFTTGRGEAECNL